MNMHEYSKVCDEFVNAVKISMPILTTVETKLNNIVNGIDSEEKFEAIKNKQFSPEEIGMTKEEEKKMNANMEIIVEFAGKVGDLEVASAQDLKILADKTANVADAGNELCVATDPLFKQNIQAAMAFKDRSKTFKNPENVKLARSVTAVILRNMREAIRVINGCVKAIDKPQALIDKVIAVAGNAQ